VISGSYDQSLYALRRTEGSLAWSLETESYVHASPAIAGDRAWITGCDGYLRGVALADGTEVERLALAGYVASSPALADGRAYVGTFENQFLAVDLEGPSVAWTYEDREREFPFYASAAVTSDLVLAAGRDKTLHAIDRASGDRRWSFEGKARMDSSPVVVGDRAFIASKAGDLYALALEDGSVRWSYELGSPVVASPAVADGVLVIGTLDGTVYAFGAAQ
jgi:outer membrane protein assembly factor BamB